MSILNRVLAGFGVALVAFAVIGIVSYVNTNRMVEDQEWTQHTEEVLTELARVLALSTDLETGQRGYLITNEEIYLEPYTAGLPALHETVSSVRILTEDNPGQQERLDSLDVLLAAKEAELEETIQLNRTSGFAAAREVVLLNTGKEIMDLAREVVAAMEAEEQRLLVERTATGARGVALTKSVIGWGFGGTVVLFGALGFWLSTTLGHGVSALKEGLDRIGEGEIHHRITLDTQDEMGLLASSINALGETLERAVTDRELLDDTVREVAGRLAASSSEILAAAAQQAVAADQQTVAVTETMTSVEEVRQTAEQSAERANAMLEMSKHTIKVGESGRDAVERAVANVDRVNEESTVVMEHITVLADQAQAIGEIIATVNDIADQTNLISLNASIEASRAGEHGKAFAVVASEVKALAEQSKRSTVKVRQILSEIQRATDGAVTSTETAARSLAETTEVIAQAGDAIRQLTDSLGEAAGGSSQLAASADQQATGVGHIGRAMEEIERSSVQTQSAMAQTRQSAEHLTELAERLSGLLQNSGG